jgi:hypothetical protein
MTKHYRSLDWGRKMDYTALSDVTRAGEWPHWTFIVNNAVRYPLGTRFHTIIYDLQVRPYPADWNPDETVLITDASGIGDVLLEDLRRAGFDPIGVVITAGGSVSRDEQDRRLWHCGRNILVDTLRTRLGTSLHLRCSTEMAVFVVKEAASMQYSISAAMHTIFEPRQGAHDDLLLSISMACWYGTNEGQPAISLSPAEIERILAESGHEVPRMREIVPRRLWGNRPRYW